MAGVVWTATSIGEVDGLLDVPDDPLGEDGLAKLAAQETLDIALPLIDPASSAFYYESFLARFPLAEESPSIMRYLAVSYSRMGRHDDAIRLIDGAIALVSDATQTSGYKLYRVEFDIAAGKYDQAEGALQAIMDAPPVSLDDLRFTHAAFIAPSYLAKIRVAQGRKEEAKEILRASIEKADQLRLENLDKEWLQSWVMAGFSELYAISIEERDFDTAFDVLAECNRRTQGFDRSNAGQYDGMLENWRMYANTELPTELYFLN